MRIFKSGFLFLLCLIPLMILFSSCSDDDDLTAPVSSSKVSLDIGADGGTLTLNKAIHLYVPAGSVSASMTFELEELYSPPPPPDGCVQVGPAFSAMPGGMEFADGVALGLEFDYPYTGPMWGSLVQLNRLTNSGQWEPVKGAGSFFSLSLSATVSELGTFAAHVDTSTGSPDDVFAAINLDTWFAFWDESGHRSWRTYANAEFWNNDRTLSLTDTGGSVRVGEFDLGPGGVDCYYVSNRHEVDPGSSHHVRLSGGDEIPALSDTLHYFDEDLFLTNPSEENVTISRLEPYTITWEGAGPQLVWLIYYGDAPDGSFLSYGQMRPNTGEFTIMPEELAGFEEDGYLRIFLRQLKACPISMEGYHRSSYFLVECSSSMGVTVH